MASRIWRGSRSDMICPVCKLKMTVPRNNGQQREKGHRKDIYCIKCKCKRSFIEVREKDFTLENVL